MLTVNGFATTNVDFTANSLVLTFTAPVSYTSSNPFNGPIFTAVSGNPFFNPFGDVIGECRALNDEFVVGELTPEKLTSAGGFRYTQARRPELYKDIIGREHTAELKISWLDHDKK